MSSTHACTLPQGHAIGRLLLHGLSGAERERERGFMAATAQRIVARLSAKVKGRLAPPGQAAASSPTLLDLHPRMHAPGEERRPVGAPMLRGMHLQSCFPKLSALLCKAQTAHATVCNNGRV